MLLEELIEKAFSDGYEYALKEKIFFLSSGGNAFTGEDILKERRDSVLRYGNGQKDLKLAYVNKGSELDQKAAFKDKYRELQRKGVKDSNTLVSNAQKASHEAYKNSRNIVDVKRKIAKQKFNRTGLGKFLKRIK
jgi:hypothetical protein